MDFFKTWISPPLIGAIIGYFTNWLAIKMLFRPLKPVYIGKLKLPFTPGILPKERRRLSKSAGDIVSKELLNADVFESRLRDPLLQEKIETSIFVLIDGYLSKDAATVLRGFRKDTVADSEMPEKGDSDLQHLLVQSLETVVHSREFRQAAAKALERTAADVAQMPVGSLISAKRVRELAGGFAEKCGDEDTQGLVDSFIDRIASGGKSDREPLLPAGATSPLIDVVTRSLYSGLLPAIEKFLSSPTTKAEIERAAMDMIRQAVMRLGPVQRLIVNAANYEKTLAETMPKTVENLVQKLMDFLKSPGMAGKVSSSVLAYLETSRGADKGADKPKDLIAGIVPSAELKKALAALLSDLGADKTNFAARVEERFVAISDKTLREILPEFTKLMKASLVGGLVESSFEQKEAPVFSASLSEFLDSYATLVEGQTIGDLLKWQQEEKRRVASILTGALTQALSSQAGRLVDALDIETMVVDKIDELDLVDVERIILKVVKNELSWITTLGGVLGALIGIVQSIISIL